jgi:dTDP-4-dehydrorhamnose reductase
VGVVTALVTGANGLLGPYLVDAFGPHVTTSARRSGDAPCELADAAAVRELVARIKPTVVVHAAAMTAIDLAEAEPQIADDNNRRTTENLAAALPANCKLVYISTDQVYPNVAGPHREGSEAPVNVYGRTKLAGERAAAAHPRALILRTNLFGPSRTPGRTSLSDFVVDSLRTDKPVTLFRDVLFSPLHMTTLASLVREMSDAGLTGTYNLGSREGISKADFAIAIADHLGLSLANARIGLSTEFANRAQRPLDLRLDVARVEKAVGRAMPTCRAEIACL